MPASEEEWARRRGRGGRGAARQRGVDGVATGDSSGGEIDLGGGES